jgi:hypothetical protein
MNTENENNITAFRSKLSIYYQSVIIYIAVFTLYIIVRGEFVEDEFKLLTKDPIIYFLGIIVIVSVLALVYNIIKNKYIELPGNGISFISRFGKRFLGTEDIKWVKISGMRGENKALRVVRIKLKNRRRPVLIRPHDYENESALLKRFEELKANAEKGLNK